MAIVVNHLKEIQDILQLKNDKTLMFLAFQASEIYLDIGSTNFNGLSFQSDFAATRPKAAPVLNDPGILELKDISYNFILGPS